MTDRRLKGENHITIDHETLTVKRKDKYLSFQHSGFSDTKVNDDYGHPDARLRAKDGNGTLNIKTDRDQSVIRAVHGFQGDGLKRSVSITVIQIPRNKAEKLIKAIKNRERYSDY